MDEAKPSTSSLPERSHGIVATAAVLAFLYLGRDVLIPITLAVLLSLLIAPSVRFLSRRGFGHGLAVFAAVTAFSVSFVAVGIIIGSQLVRMSASFPEYEATVRQKLATLNELTVGRVTALTGRAGRVLEEIDHHSPARPLAPAGAAGERSAGETPIPVELHAPPTSPLELLETVLARIWVPLETAGIVFVVLVFVLLEHEALRDRFIRIAGGSDVRRTTSAINDAGERLSKFFFSQFIVNASVGGLIGAGLLLIGLPHAFLWAAMAAVLRFIPYIGIWIAALLAALLGAAVDPGWSLAFLTLGLFAVVETIAGQLVEPQLYGHTTGLSPLSVVVAAIFWSWLWGPVGLIVSTPLTMCLLVAGRNFKTLSLLDVLLSDAQALTMPQRFYQRALSADADEIIVGARAFLKRQSFAVYCDTVLIPALHLARIDLQAGTISEEQQFRVRSAVVDVIAALGGETRRSPRRRRASLLEATTPGQELRQQRELVSGKWQGPLEVPAGSIILCAGLGSFADDLATELMTRIFRDQKIDARHTTLQELSGPTPPGGSPDSVSMVYLVSAFPSEERKLCGKLAAALRERFPQACIVTVFLPGLLLQPAEAAAPVAEADASVASFSDAVQVGLAWHQRTG